MKVSFAPFVVLFVSTTLVDAIAEKPGQSSSSLAMEKSATEMNVKEENVPKQFEVKPKNPRPEDAEPAPFLAENVDKKTDSVKHIKTVDDNEKLKKVKSDDDEKDDDEKDDDEKDDDEKDDDEKDDDEKDDDEKDDIVKIDDFDDEDDKVKSDDENKKFKNVKIDNDYEKFDDVKSDDKIENFDKTKAANDEKDIENTEKEVEKVKDQSEESVNSPDEETIKNYQVSTVYTTVTSTVTDCESLVTVCPEIGSVVTKTISLYTTICPETTSTPAVPLVTAPAIPDSSKVSYLTKTVETTLWYTVTECPPQETDCSIGLETSSVATYLDVQKTTYENTHTIDEDAPIPTTTLSKPYVTGSPSYYLPAPQSNVTMPVVPLNPTYDGASAKNFDGFAMYLGLAVAATATLFLQGWY